MIKNGIVPRVPDVGEVEICNIVCKIFNHCIFKISVVAWKGNYSLKELHFVFALMHFNLGRLKKFIKI